MMRSSQTSADASGPVRPLQVSVEILANLIYLARRTETHSERDQYLDWAAKLLRSCSSIRSFAIELRRR
jgi:hypothetical protein